MTETKQVWLVKFDDFSESIYIIADSLKQAIDKGIKTYNESFDTKLTEENVSSIEYICGAEE